MKNHLAISISILFIVLASCKNNSETKDAKQSAAYTLEKECIENIIAQDEKWGKKRNTDSETMPLSKTIDSYVINLQSLEYANCPKNFSLAFGSHVEAWIAIKRVTDNYPELRGEMHDLFDELKKSKDSTVFKSLESEIWTTWNIVEGTTLKYKD